MAAGVMKTGLLFLFIKHAIFDRGFINDLHTNRKFQCARSVKEVFTVNSQIQCSHRCLRRSCSRLNYNMKNGEKDNCEVFTEIGECSDLSGQDGWKAIKFEVEPLHRVRLDISITSYGKSDPGFSFNPGIIINGIDKGKMRRGFNVVVISPTNGYTLGVGHFDTYGETNDSAAMISFISNYPDGSIVCIATADSAERKLTQDAKDYLAGLGSVGISSINLRTSFAMLTAKGVPKPSWFVEKYASKGKGPSTIQSTLQF